MALLLKSKQKILAAVVRNPGINVNSLIKEVGSIHNIKSILDELEKKDLIYSKRIGAKKTIRMIYPKNKQPIYKIVEQEEKELKEKNTQ